MPDLTAVALPDAGGLAVVREFKLSGVDPAFLPLALAVEAVPAVLLWFMFPVPLWVAVVLRP